MALAEAAIRKVMSVKIFMIAPTSLEVMFIIKT